MPSPLRRGGLGTTKCSTPSRTGAHPGRAGSLTAPLTSKLQRMADSSSAWPERLPAPTHRRDHTEREHVERYRWARGLVYGDVLDAACGTGYGTAMLSEQARVTGLDRNCDAVRVAQQIAPRATIVRAELPVLRFANASFDFVVSFETVEHVKDDATLVAEMRRVLKPDGTLLISTPNGVVSSEKDDWNPWHVREYELSQLQVLLNDAGFTSMQIFQQRVPNFGDHVALRQIRRVVARFPVLCSPGRWWDTIAHGSPFVEPWDGISIPFFWVLRVSV
jgi:2-polyprenyl-3-methyl-5-hydroxy-6-metoxy-1,4-benzoquinol methylase